MVAPVFVGSIFTKGIGDRWRGTAIGTLLIGLFLVGGLAAYREIDLSIYTDLPEGIRSIMNIPADADVASLGFGVIYGLMGAMTLAGLSISMGASSFAGEERDGTLGLLLANPQSRAKVLISKVGAMIVVLTLGAMILWAAAYFAPGVLDVDMGRTHRGAYMIHMFANALFFGFLAAAVGAWSGNRMMAVAVSTGVMVLSYVAVGLLPLSAATADGVYALPWYYFDGSVPLTNGVSAPHLGVQLSGAVLFSAVALLGVDRRDLRKPGAGIKNLLDRLRENPHTAIVVDRLAGGARVSGTFTKTASENQVLLIVVSAVMFSSMGLLMGPMFKAIEGDLVSLTESLPENLLAIVGGGDLSTPEGWYQVETLGLMAPIAIMLVTIVLGTNATAGEEARRTMSLLLANPISRRQIVVEKAAAIALQASVVGYATFAGIVGGSVIAGLGMSIANVAFTCMFLTLLGILFGFVALAIGAATGRSKQAQVGAVAVAGGLYMANSLFTIADLPTAANISPFHWYLGHEPLVNGMNWGSAATFVVAIAVVLAAAVTLFERRDLRNVH